MKQYSVTMCLRVNSLMNKLTTIWHNRVNSQNTLSSQYSSKYQLYIKKAISLGGCQKWKDCPYDSQGCYLSHPSSYTPGLCTTPIVPLVLLWLLTSSFSSFSSFFSQRKWHHHLARKLRVQVFWGGLLGALAMVCEALSVVNQPCCH